MSIREPLFFRPVSWSVVVPATPSSSIRGLSLFPYVQVFGSLLGEATIYLRIPLATTYIFRFNHPVDEDLIAQVRATMNSTSMKRSNLSDNVLVVRTVEPFIEPLERVACESITRDPFGEVESLWEAREIGPYEWLRVENYSPLPMKYSNCTMSVKSREEYISSATLTLSFNPPPVSLRLFFWDIETFSSRVGEFPDSSNLDDFIAAISVVAVEGANIKGYVITTTSPYVHEQSRYKIVRASDERDLLLKFFTIYKSHNPDRQIYYNGDMFDMPYLVNRLLIHGIEIPKVSKLPCSVPVISTQEYPTPLGRQISNTVIFPGCETVDLVHFYRDFYPHFKDYKLDTVAKYIIGEGKTGFTIEEMMDAIRTGDKKQLTLMIEYSFVDSLRMWELWDAGEVCTDMERVGNNVGCSIDTLLRQRAEYVVDLAAYNIDPGSVVVRGKRGYPTHLKSPEKGIYKGIFIYDYSELYREIMLKSKDSLTRTLADRLEGSTPNIIVASFYSPHANRKELLRMFNKAFREAVGSSSISTEKFIVRTRVALNASWAREITRASGYISPTKSSYIVFDDLELEFVGLSKLCRPKFPLVGELVRRYVVHIFTGVALEIPKVGQASVDDLTMVQKLGDNADLIPGSLKHSLSLQQGAEINTWIRVKYIMTMRGPTLLSRLLQVDTIDEKYYLGQINKYLKELRQLRAL